MSQSAKQDIAFISKLSQSKKTKRLVPRTSTKLFIKSKNFIYSRVGDHNHRIHNEESGLRSYTRTCYLGYCLQESKYHLWVGIPQGKFSLELIFTNQKVKKLRGGKSGNFHFFSFDCSPKLSCFKWPVLYWSILFLIW